MTAGAVAASSVGSVLSIDRPTRHLADVVRAAVAAVLFALLASRANAQGRAWVNLFHLVNDLPGKATGAASAVLRLGVVALIPVAIGAAAAVRNWRLLRDLVVAGVVAVIASRVVDRWVDALPASDIPGAVLRVSRVPGSTFPALPAALAAAFVVAASPYLGARLTRWLRFVVLLVAIVPLYLGTATVVGVLGGLALGALVGLLLHLALGSPGGHPSERQVRAALAALGYPSLDLDVTQRARGGVLVLEARPPDGPAMTVEVIGNDQRDAELFAWAWRWLLYREGTWARFTQRLHATEHRAYLTLVAGEAGVRVPEVIGTTRAGSRGAVYVTRSEVLTPVIDVDPAQVDDELLDAIWSQVETLHRRGIVHGRLDGDAIALDADGSPVLRGFGAAEISASSDRLRHERAEVVVITAGLADDDRAVAAADRALGPDVLGELVPAIQHAAMTPGTQRRLIEKRQRLEPLREAVAERVGIIPPPTERLTRVSLSTLLLLIATLSLVAVVLPRFSGATRLLSSLTTVSWPWLLAVVGAWALSMVALAVGLMGSTAERVPLLPAVGVQFATATSNVVNPPGIATSALLLRFLRRCGLTSGGAVAAVFLWQVATTAALMAVFLVFALPAKRSMDEAPVSLTTVVIVTVALLIGAGGLLWIEPIRRRALQPVRRALSALWQALRTPRTALQLVLGVVAAPALLGVALWASLEAFGASLDYPTLVTLVVLGSAITSAIPVPGGLGAQEVFLYAGLRAAGIDAAVALAAVISYRVVTFWGAPVVGEPTQRLLRRRSFL